MSLSLLSPKREAVEEHLPLPEQILQGNPVLHASDGPAEGHSPTGIRKKDVFDSLPAIVAVLDTEGFIVDVNESWRRSAAAYGLQAPAAGIGSNYLEVCDRVVGEEGLPASRAAAGIRSVLRGSASQFSMEYVLQLPSEDLWFFLIVSPVGGEHPTGATVIHFDITARKHHEGKLWRFAAALDSLPDAVFVIDRLTMRLTYFNDAACQLLRMSREQLLQTRAWEMLSMSQAETQRMYDRIVAAGGIAEPEEVLRRRADGTEFWAEIRRHTHCLDGAVSVVILMRDITARKAAESRIVYLSRVHAILSGINALIVRVGNREELYREACRIPVEKGGFPVCWIGILDQRTNKLVPTATAGMGAQYLEIIERRLLHDSSEALEQTYIMRAIRDKQIRICNDSRNDESVLAADQHEVHGIRSFAMLPLMVADKAVGVIALYAGEPDFFRDEEIRLLAELAGDVSFAIDHIQKQERLDHLAFYDSLTGLANPQLFHDRLAQYVRNAEDTGQQIAVCITAIERFRNLNDILGRASGDALLSLVAAWLVDHFGNATLVGRLDSDRFAVVLTNVESEAAAARTVEMLINSFVADSFRVAGKDYRISLKVGVAMFPHDGDEPAVLCKNAGSALTKAKAGPDAYLFYARRMTETVAGRLGMENQLRQALEHDEFVIHYQPKFQLATGRMVGAEALLRWNDPLAGLVAPSRFIPLLEETGLILEVGRWVLRKVIEDQTQWRRAGYPGLRIAVNVSPVQLRHGSFVPDIQRFVATDCGLSANLELEITESLIMEDVNRSIAALQVMRELGITIAIDDFGTGYSSLSHLAKLPVDILKIDRSFIFDMTAEPSGRLLVSTIINLAHSLDLNVVAEGVETAEQADTLRLLNCDAAQGYLYGRPQPAALFQEKHLQGAATR